MSVLSDCENERTVVREANDLAMEAKQAKRDGRQTRVQTWNWEGEGEV